MRTSVALALASLVAGCGGGSGTLVVVTIDSASALTDVRTAHLSATGGGRTKSFDVQIPSQMIPPAQTIGIDVPPDVTGLFSVHADILDSRSVIVASADQSITLTKGARNDLTVTVSPGGGGGGDMASAGADMSGAAVDLAGANADLTYFPACGNGVRDPLEGCDDGNTVSGDGCSATCVIEPEFRTAFVGTALTLNGAWMAVAQSGTIYAKSSGGGGGKDSIYKIDTAGNVTANALTGVLSTYGGDVRTIGDDLYSCGNWIDTAASPQHNHATCQKWIGGTGSPATVMDQIDLTYYYAYATSDGNTWWFDTVNTSPSDFRKSLSVSTSSQISTSLQGGLIYHPTLGILVASGSSIMKDTGGSGTGPFASAYSLSAGNIGVMALDRNNELWVSCHTFSGTGYTPCAAGSVWIVDLTTMTAKPAIDNFADAQGLGYDPTGHYLVLLAQNKLWRFAN